MKATISTKELKDALKRVAFEKKGFQKAARLTASNNQIILEAATFNMLSKEIMNAEVERAGSVFVDTEELIKAVKSLKTKTVEIYRADNKLVLKAGIEFKISTYYIESFPAITELSGTKVYLHSFDLKEGLEKTAHILASKKERTGRAIDHIYFNFIKKSALVDELEMVATDGHRLSLYKCDVYAGNYNGGLLISKEAAELLKKAFDKADGDVEIYIEDKEDEKIATFKSGNYLLSIQTPSEAIFEYKYPDYKSIFLKEEDINLRVKLNTQEFSEIVKSLVATEPSDKKPIILSFLNGKLTISNASGNHSVIDVDTDKAFEIGFNGKYLLDAIDVIYDSEFTMEMHSKDFQIHIKANDNFIHLLAPMHI
jgi:DNA polymerase-3 subunit beta